MSNASSKTVSKFPHPVLALLIVMGLFFAGQIAGSIVLSILVVATGGDIKDITVFGSAITAQFAYMAAVELLTLGALAYCCKRLGLTRQDLGLVRPRISDPLWAVLTFLAYMTVYAILLQAVTLLVPGFNAEAKQDIGFEGAHGFLQLGMIFSVLVLLVPLTEEVLFRGFFFGALRRRWRLAFSIAVTSSVFAILHLGGGEQGAGLLWVAAVDTFVLSLALCLLREKTGRLWPSVFLHATKNGVAFLYLFVFAVGR